MKNDIGFSMQLVLFSHKYPYQFRILYIYSKKYSTGISNSTYVKRNISWFSLWLFYLFWSHYFSWQQRCSQGWNPTGFEFFHLYFLKIIFRWHFCTLPLRFPHLLLCFPSPLKVPYLELLLMFRKWLFLLSHSFNRPDEASKSMGLTLLYYYLNVFHFLITLLYFLLFNLPVIAFPYTKGPLTTPDLSSGGQVSCCMASPIRWVF